jgi:hypothetical protein
MSHSSEEPLLRQRAGGKIMEFLIPLAILAAWLILQAWVLPRCGVKT